MGSRLLGATLFNPGVDRPGTVLATVAAGDALLVADELRLGRHQHPGLAGRARVGKRRVMQADIERRTGRQGRERCRTPG